MASSEAAVSEKAKAYSCYVEPLSDARTKLGGIFSIPLAGVAELADARDLKSLGP